MSKADVEIQKVHPAKPLPTTVERTNATQMSPLLCLRRSILVPESIAVSPTPTVIHNPNIASPSRPNIEEIINYVDLEERVQKLEHKVEENIKCTKSLATQANNLDSTHVKSLSAEERLNSPRINEKSVHLVGNSHIRGLKSFLERKIPKSWRIDEFCESGASFSRRNEVCPTNPRCNEYHVVMCGSSDVRRTSWEEIESSNNETIYKLREPGYIGIVTV